MAKTQLKGLAQSEGIIRQPYAAGKYAFTVTEVEETTTKNGDYMLVARHTIGDTYPEQPGKRKVEGKTYTHRFVVIEGHESYDFFIAKLKDWLTACGVRVASDNSFNHKAAVGKELFGDMALSPDKRDGTMQAQVAKWYSPEAFAALGSGASSEDEEE
jgi:hypothetical protein